MTQDILLHQLRERLRLIQQRIAEREQESALRIGIQSLVAAGALTELRSEAAFLSDLIGQIEREGVTP